MFRLLECCQFSDSRLNCQCGEFIFGSQVADGGTYTCKVSNVAGQADRTFRLTVHGTKAALLSFLLRMYSCSMTCSTFHTLISTHIYSSTSPGRFSLGVLKLHPGFTRVPAMPGRRIPCAEYHLAERRNSYWSVLTAFIWFTGLFRLQVLHCILEGELNRMFHPPRKQPAVAVVHPREQAGAGAPHSGSRWALHLCGQEQWGTSTERLRTHSTR